jgi:hypothetical protein
MDMDMDNKPPGAASSLGQIASMRESWESFESAVMPPGVPAVQRSEMRRAFYAGAWAVLCVLRRLGDDDVSEETGGRVLESLTEECRRFQAFQARIGVDR